MAFFVAYMCHTTYLCIRFSEYSGVTIHFQDMGSQLELFPCGKLGFNERCGKLSSTPLRRSAASRGERIRLRNRVMTARLYYWREIMRRRLDDVMIILAETSSSSTSVPSTTPGLNAPTSSNGSAAPMPLSASSAVCFPAGMVTLYIVYKIGCIYNLIDFEPVRSLLRSAPRSSE